MNYLNNKTNKHSKVLMYGRLSSKTLVPSPVRVSVTGWPSMNFQRETCMASRSVLELSSYEKVPFRVLNSESALNSCVLALFSPCIKRSMC